MLKPIIDKIKEVLSLKTASWIIVGISLIGRIIQLVFFFNIRVDGSYQYMAMQNFVHGHGISTAKVLPSDLSTIVYEPLINWPPGYSILLSPFYLLTGHNYIAAGIILDIICATALILFSRKILKLLGVPVHFVNIYTILTSFFIYPFYFIASSDAIAISFFVAAIYLTLALVKNNSHYSWKILALTFCLAVAGWIKYLFIPAVFVVPLILYGYGYISRHRRVKRAAVYSFFTLLIAIGGLLLYQKTVSGSAAYISQPDRGFFPQHILNAYPFLPASIMKPETVQLAGINTGTLLIAYQLVHVIIILFLLVYVIRSLMGLRSREISLRKFFFYLSVFTSCAIVGVLLILSLRVGKEEILPGWFWTYLEEPRYYGLVFVFIHLSIFIFARNANVFLRKFLLAAIVLMAVESIRGVYFDARRLVLLGNEQYSWQYENEFQKAADHIIRRERELHRIKKVVVTGSVYYMSHRISLYSHVPVLYPAHTLNNSSLLTSKERVLVLVVLKKEDFSKFKPFLRLHPDKLAGQYDEFYFYTVYVDPG